MNARDRIVSILPFLRVATETATADGGSASLGVLSERPDGSGKVVTRFDADDFFRDLREALDAPEETEEQLLDARAVLLLDTFGLRAP